MIRALQLPGVWLILSFFVVFMTLFPTLRVILIGKENASGIAQYLVSGLPDLFIGSILLWQAWTSHEKIKTFKFSRLDVFMMLIFSLNVLVGSLLSGDPKLILLGVRLTYIPVGLYFIARLAYNGSFFEQLKKWLDLVMLWFSVMAFIGFIMYYFLPEMENNLNAMVGGQQGEYFIKRMNSIFYSPTVNGMFCCMAALYYLQKCFDRFSNWHLSLLLLNFWSLLLTVSRGGIIAFFLILIIAVIVSRQWKNIGITVGMMVLVFFMALHSVGLSLSNFSWVFTSTAETIGMGENVSRVELWKRTFEDLKEKPFGYGIGKSGWIAYRFLKDSDEESAYLATDGWYLKAANETGIFGLISYLLLLAYLFFRFLKENERKEEMLFILYLLTVVILVNLVSNVLDYFLFNALFWFLMGAAENNITRKCENCER